MHWDYRINSAEVHRTVLGQHAWIIDKVISLHKLGQVTVFDQNRLPQELFPANRVLVGSDQMDIKALNGRLSCVCTCRPNVWRSWDGQRPWLETFVKLPQTLIAYPHPQPHGNEAVSTGTRARNTIGLSCIHHHVQFPLLEICSIWLLCVTMNLP